METFTEHQVRTVVDDLMHGDSEGTDAAIEAMRRAPKNAGALGLTDDELKGTARDTTEG